MKARGLLSDGRGVCVWLCLGVALRAHAAPLVDHLRVWSEQRPGSALHELHARADVGAPVLAMSAVLGDAASYVHFMPYVVESRVLGERPDGTRQIYVRLAPPWVQSRDYVVREWSSSQRDGGTLSVFDDHWESVPDAVPARAETIRLRVNQGSWHLVARPDGRTEVDYRFVVDPAGSLPAFVMNLANASGVKATIEAVAQEAARRGAETAVSGPGR